MAGHERRAIGEILRAHRLRANLSQNDLAARMSVYYGIVAKIERNEQAPTRDQLNAFIAALELSANEAAELRSAYEFEPPAGLLPGHTQFDRHVCPYRGLHAFLEQDADFYCGRETAAKRLAAKVAVSSVVAVVGASGSGKSSLVQAGLLPELRREQQYGGLLTAGFRPGPDPFAALASGLIELTGHGPTHRSPADLVHEVTRLARMLRERGIESVLSRLQHALGKPVLLIADQFEEVFTHCTDAALADDFLDGLAVLGGRTGYGTAPIKLVLTLRGDYYGHALARRSLSDLLQDNVVHVPPMNRDELRAAITEPARHGNITLEPGLLDRIMDDVGSDPGNLPLLEYALMLLWERQQARKMTIAAYEGIGGVRGAIAAQAEQVYSALAPEQQNTARRLLTSLVRVAAPGEEGADTRRRAPRSELNPLPRVDRVLEVLTGARLLVADADARGEPFIELAHEAVITAWRRLQVWLEDDRQFLLWQQQLRQRCQEWRENDRIEAALLRGAILERALGWIDTRGAAALPADLLEYVEASRVAQQEEERRRATPYLDALRTARAGNVPEIVRQLRRIGGHAADLPGVELPEHWEHSPEAWRVRLARLWADFEQMPLILRDLPNLSPGEVLAVRRVLAELPPERMRTLTEQLWRDAAAQSPDPAQNTDAARFRYAVLLAELAPEDSRWDLIATATAQLLCLEDARLWPDLRSAFAPVMDRLVEPLVRQVCEGQSARALERAAGILLEVAGDRADVLGRILCHLPEHMYEHAFGTLESALRGAPGEPGRAGDRASAEEARRCWSALADAQASMEPAGAGADEQVAAGRRRAAAACTLLRLGRWQGVLERFERADPDTGAQFASAAALRKVPFQLLVDRLRAPVGPQTRSTLLLAMGEYRPGRFLSAAALERLAAELAELYRDDPSAAVHAACGWLARRWDIPFDPLFGQAAYDPTGRRGWFTVTVEDHVLGFSVLRPGTFAMGSPLGERGRAEWESPMRHTTLTRSYAVCTAEVTRSLFESFVALGGAWLPGPDGWQPHPAEPIVSVTWFEATDMCRWLTDQLGIGRGPAPHPAGDYGFRLPTEAEWEYACRAGTSTPYSFGADRSLLTNYAWFEDNAGGRTHEAGILRPNPAGLFNMHGQCWEWCQDWFGPYGAEPVSDPAGVPDEAVPDAAEDPVTSRLPQTTNGSAAVPDGNGAPRRAKVLRGGSWIQNEAYARSAARRALPPGNRNSDVSFRLVCTVPEPDASGATTLPWTG